MAGLTDISLGNFTKVYYEDLDSGNAEVEIANVQSFSHPSDERNIIDVPQYGQTYQRKLAGSASTGAAELVVNFNPADATHQYLLAEYKSGRIQTFKVEVLADESGTAGSFYTFKGQVASKSASGDFDSVTTITFSLSVDGALGDWTDNA
ncbi:MULTISPECIES: phage tail tube protein [Vibrio harveyi group]|uniref:phage tail tube protein n=1 Tax=Vibrio harveyi group TaxID=717610 RepID=UPI001BD5A616|nr:phage tail tube protein [Vibrio alginolyticus]MBS9935789.1 hypothetical protein [Vibrio alginolyticus]